MTDFAAGRIDVLVATTVIEVGVDVPNATVMVDHGRRPVRRLAAAPAARPGRPRRPCRACACSSPTPTPGTPARERLDAVAATTDGFELARLDVEQRREGDVLGAAQSGPPPPAAAAVAAARRGAHRRRPRRGGRHRRRRPDPRASTRCSPRRCAPWSATSRPSSWRRHEPPHRRRRGQGPAARRRRPTGTRPTSDRAREALFNTLAAQRATSTAPRVLDLYAGTGAVGLEALSRGAAEAVLVETDRAALAVLRRNVATVGLPGARRRRRGRSSAFLADGAGRAVRPACSPTRPTPSASEVPRRRRGPAAAGGWLAPDAVVVVERSARDAGRRLGRIVDHTLRRETRTARPCFGTVAPR